MARGHKFARGVPARRDLDGHCLPSDRWLQFVQLDLMCACCERAGVVTLLARFKARTLQPDYREGLLEEEGPNRGIVERNDIPRADGTTYVQYKLRCRRCRHSPALREQRIHDLMREHYAPFAYEVVVRFAL